MSVTDGLGQCLSALLGRAVGGSESNAVQKAMGLFLCLVCVG